MFNLKWGSVFVEEQAFYYEGKAIMSNEEFDNLKEELIWEGSTIVNKEFDDLKLRLKVCPFSNLTLATKLLSILLAPTVRIQGAPLTKEP